MPEADNPGAAGPESEAVLDAPPEPSKVERDAAVTAAMAAVAPLEVAAENARLRSSVRGAYALIHVLVRRLGGDVTVGGEALRQAGAGGVQQLVIETGVTDNDPDSVRAYIEAPGHQRPKRKR